MLRILIATSLLLLTGFSASADPSSSSAQRCGLAMTPEESLTELVEARTVIKGKVDLSKVYSIRLFDLAGDSKTDAEVVKSAMEATALMAGIEIHVQLHAGGSFFRPKTDTAYVRISRESALPGRLAFLAAVQRSNLNLQLVESDAVLRTAWPARR